MDIQEKVIFFMLSMQELRDLKSQQFQQWQGNSMDFKNKKSETKTRKKNILFVNYLYCKQF